MTYDNRCQHGQGGKTALLAAFSALTAILLTAMAVWTLTLPAIAQTTEEPQPQTPNTIAAGYHDEMTAAEVEAECDRINQAVNDEYDRLIGNIGSYESTHPDYHQAEKEKLDGWLQSTSTEQTAECQRQRQAAADRRPAAQIPEQIAYGYHDEMTAAEVEAECDRIYGLIADEVDRMRANIAPYADSHPDHFADESERINAWQDTADSENAAECQRQKQAAADRIPAETIDDLYPEISPEIKQLANRIGLTDRAKRILYNNNPLILDDANHPDFTCGGGTFADTYIHGCWDHSGPIKLLRDNSIETTLAHELLHVIYYREYYLTGANKGIDEQIDIIVARNPRQTSIILNAYAEQINSLPSKTGRYIKYTELYAFIGTQFTDSTNTLEDHYAKYFKDRQTLVDIFHDWVVGTRAKIKEREAYANQLVNQANEYLKCLNDANRTTGDCRAYHPDRSRYAAYDECLTSRKTFVSDCQHLRPANLVAYTPAPVPTAPPVQTDDEDLQALIAETEELVSQVQEEQEEAEDSFIHQLVFYDHDLDDPDDEADLDATNGSGRPAETGEPETGVTDDENEEEAVPTEEKPAEDDEGGQAEDISDDPGPGRKPAAAAPWGWLIAAIAISAGLIITALFFNLRRRADKPAATSGKENDAEDEKTAGKGTGKQ